MDPNVMPDIKLYTIEEDYPDPNNINRQCQNKGVMIPLTQTYYTCVLNSDNSTEYRVTSETYQDLTYFPYFKERISCKIERG